MHVVDDVHGLVVYSGHLMQHFLVVCKHFFIVKHIAFEGFDAGYHQGPGVFASSSVYGKQESLCEVGPCAEELYCLPDGLI